MFPETNQAQISKLKKRVRPTSQFVQHKDECSWGKRRKIKGEQDLEHPTSMDRISELSDEILVSILSLLPLKQAGATSILSRRWRYVWASTMTLNFDAVNFDVGNNLDRFLELTRESRYQESYRYANWVNRVVEQHVGPNIQRFRACFFLDYRFQSSIDKWIQFAMEKRVQILELEFLGDTYAIGEDYTFPHKLLGISIKKGSALEQFLYSAWENLHSGILSLHSCGNSTVGFKSLKVLRLRHVDVADELIEYLLSNCPVLERLSLNAARGLTNFRVVGPSVVLKHLLIRHCKDLKCVQICDTNIVSFIYFGRDMVNLVLNNVPLLVEVSICTGLYSLTRSLRLPCDQLSSCLSQLQILGLEINGADYNQNDVIPVLQNLKHLELGVVAGYNWALHHLTFFLKAAPYLHRLKLKLAILRTSRDYIGEMEKAAKCPHHYLKVVEILGYRAHTFAAEHVIYLAENAIALEKIVIDPVRSWCRPSGMDRPIEEVEEEVKGRADAMQHLKEKVPSTIEFVCM